MTLQKKETWEDVDKRGLLFVSGSFSFYQRALISLEICGTCCPEMRLPRTTVKGGAGNKTGRGDL